MRCPLAIAGWWRPDVVQYPGRHATDISEYLAGCARAAGSGDPG